MARIPRILESANGNGSFEGPEEGSVENRRSRVEAVLRRAENFLALHLKALTRAGALQRAETPEARIYEERARQEAREYRKKAHQEARLAARLLGVMEIEFGLAMGPEVERAKKVFTVIKAPVFNETGD